MLFGSEIGSAVYVADDFWASPVGLSGADKECLIRPFILEELEQAVKRNEKQYIPWPRWLLHYLFQRDGFSTTSFKEFWDQCKDSLLEMLNVLHKGELDLSRLNYSIITLIRKLRGPQISNKSERFAS